MRIALYFRSRLWPISEGYCLNKTFLYLVLQIASYLPTISSEARRSGRIFQEAEIRYSYTDPEPPHQMLKTSIKGSFAMNLKKEHIKQSVFGRVVLVNSSSLKNASITDHLGCTDDYKMKVPQIDWIAFLQRGDCGFTDKINHATVDHNASTVLIYNNRGEFTVMRHRAEHKNAVLISLADGQKLEELLTKGIAIDMEITLKEEKNFKRPKQEANESSGHGVALLVLSFIVVIVLSMAWVVVYLIRRSRRPRK